MSKIFYNEKYGISAKPDRISKGKNNTVIVHEFKSRKTKIYESDIIQAMMSALAVSSEYTVSFVVVKLGNGKSKTFPFYSDAETYEKYKLFIEKAGLIKSGGNVSATPSKYKCISCSFKEVCEFAK